MQVQDTAPAAPTPPTAVDPQRDQRQPVDEAVKNEVKKWVSKIKGSKQHFDPQFKVMREDMEFVGSIQWQEQNTLDEERYIANVTMREVNQAVSSLYARNPKAVCKRRQRMDFAIWDGTYQSLIQAAQTAPFDPMSRMIIEDYVAGEQRRLMIDKIAETMETEYQIQWDRQEPDAKLQMKQLVRRIKVTGVGYVRVSFKREGRLVLNSNESATPLPDRMKQLADLTADYDAGKFDENDSRFEEMKLLLQSIQYSLTNPTEISEVNERLSFDFPGSTTVIIDPACRILKGFVGARWVAIEYCMPLDEIRSFFERPDLTEANGVQSYTSEGKENPIVNEKNTDIIEKNGLVWEVYNKQNRTRFFVCDGYEDYLLEPEEPTPCIQRFWPIIPITFNDTETEPGIKVSIYPPSDVRLMRSMQVEINTKGEAKKKHVRANRPKYLTAAGWLTDEDKLKLKQHPDNAVIELTGGHPPGTDISKLLVPFRPVPIDENLYEIESTMENVLSVIGQQQANLGPVSDRGTATEATIAEQSRISSVSSNVDDLDELLTEMARVSGEMMLREMSVDTVKRDCGEGAVWPGTPQSRAQLLDRVYLEVQAASSGRPNQGLTIAHLRDLAPLLIQAGANPQWIIEQLVKAFDERLDVTKAFPVLPPGMGMGGMPPMGGMAGGPLPPSPATPNRTPAGPPPSLPAGSDASRGQASQPPGMQQQAPYAPHPQQAMAMLQMQQNRGGQ